MGTWKPLVVMGGFATVTPTSCRSWSTILSKSRTSIWTLQRRTWRLQRLNWRKLIQRKTNWTPQTRLKICSAIAGSHVRQEKVRAMDRVFFCNLAALLALMLSAGSQALPAELPCYFRVHDAFPDSFRIWCC